MIFTGSSTNKEVPGHPSIRIVLWQWIRVLARRENVYVFQVLDGLPSTSLHGKLFNCLYRITGYAVFDPLAPSVFDPPLFFAPRGFDHNGGFSDHPRKNKELSTRWEALSHRVLLIPALSDSVKNFLLSVVTAFPDLPILHIETTLL